jgi:hypothetical protein
MEKGNKPLCDSLQRGFIFVLKQQLRDGRVERFGNLVLLNAPMDEANLIN